MTHNAPTFHATPTDFILELEAHTVPESKIQSFKKTILNLYKRSDTLVLRVAVPPLLVWAVLYSMIEYMI